jgi:hypothetical protein
VPSDKFKEISQEEYFEHFKVKDDKSKLRSKALDIVLDIRKFEIDLYWKRATYFWTFIGAALTGFIAIQQIHSDEIILWSVLIGCIGFVFSVAWYCVNRGSKQWQENWENHVDLLEDKEIGPLYKIVTGRPKFTKPWYHPKGWLPRIETLITGPGPFSVSKINQIVSLFVIFLWVGLIIKILPPFSFNSPIDPEYAIPIGVAFLAALIISVMGRTDKNDYKNLTATKRETTLQPLSKENKDDTNPAKTDGDRPLTNNHSREKKDTMEKNGNEKIAILGWGSLIWEPREDFKKYIGSWKEDGPVLPIEFSRISNSRNGALTLVIDPDNGSQVRTRYTFSNRKEPDDAVCDLRTREGTILRHIGFIDLKNKVSMGHYTFIIDKIKLWAVQKNFRAVIWTDLPSNYVEKNKEVFNAKKAIEYLKNLTKEGQKSAKEYIRNAPVEVQTSLRIEVTKDPWLNNNDEQIANQ